MRSRQLDPDLLESLREAASDKTLKRTIPEEHEKELIRLGLIERRLGGLVGTSRGKIAARTGRI